MTQGKNSKRPPKQKQEAEIAGKSYTGIKPVIVKITDKDLLARMMVVLRQSGWRQAEFGKNAVRMMVERFEEIYRQQVAEAEKTTVIIQFPKRAAS